MTIITPPFPHTPTSPLFPPPLSFSTPSPCMKILLQVKQDYMSRTGLPPPPVAAPPLRAPLPVLTRVSGTGARAASETGARARTLPKSPVDRVLMMHRSFRVGWGPNGKTLLVHPLNVFLIYALITFACSLVDTLTHLLNTPAPLSTLFLPPFLSPHSGEFIHTGSKGQHIIVNRLEPTLWAQEKSKETPLAACDTEAAMVALLTHSFVSEETRLTQGQGLGQGLAQGQGLGPVPLWRAPYAKRYDVCEYVPYLCMIQSLDKALGNATTTNTTAATSNSTSNNNNNAPRSPSWVLSQAVKLLNTVTGQETGGSTSLLSTHNLLDILSTPCQHMT